MCGDSGGSDSVDIGRGDDNGSDNSNGNGGSDSNKDHSNSNCGSGDSDSGKKNNNQLKAASEKAATMAAVEASVGVAKVLTLVAARLTAVMTAMATAMRMVTAATMTATATVVAGNSDSGGKNNNKLKAAWRLWQSAKALECGGVRRRTAICSTEWDGNGNVQVFPPCGCCRRWVAGAEEKGGSNRVVWSLLAGGANSLLFF